MGMKKPAGQNLRSNGKRARNRRAPPLENLRIKKAPAVRNDSFPVVGIGASAGGLEAFTQLLTHLPADTGMGFVLVQHLDPQHESALTQLLARATGMPVREVTPNSRHAAKTVYVTHPDPNLATPRATAKLRPQPQAHPPPPRHRPGAAPNPPPNPRHPALRSSVHPCTRLHAAGRPGCGL